MVKSSYNFSTVCFFVFVIFLFTPRIHFFEVPGIPNNFRLDIISMLIFCIFLFFYIMLVTKINIIRIDQFMLSILFFLLFFSLAFSKNIFYGLFQFIWYFSFFGVFLLFYKIATNKKVIIEKIILLFFFLNGFMNLIYYFDNNLTFFRFGFFDIPAHYAFIISVIGIYFFNRWIKKKDIFKLTLLLVFLILSESRISYAMFIITLLYPLKLKKFLPFMILIIFLSSLEIGRVSGIFEMNFLNLLNDPSFQMRVINFQNYLNWVDFSKFLIGGGSLSYLDFSITYGRPGPLDILYIRILSDHGFLFFIIILSMALKLFISNLFTINQNMITINKLIIFVLGYSFFNESLISIKTGHFFFMILGILFRLHNEEQA